MDPIQETLARRPRTIFIIKFYHVLLTTILFNELHTPATHPPNILLLEMIKIHNKYEFFSKSTVFIYRILTASAAGGVGEVHRHTEQWPYPLNQLQGILAFGFPYFSCYI